MSTLSTALADRFKDAKTAINSKYQIASFLESKGYVIESNRQIRCPFHDDSTPSFSVNKEANIWKCFGCPDGGHFIDLWIKYQQKYESKEYTVYSAVESILLADPDLQTALGFSSIYAEEEDAYDLFKEAATPTGFFDFDSTLKRSSEIKVVNVDSMQSVLRVLSQESPDKIVQFISDCENGFTETQLISKYYRKQDSVDDYISEMLKESSGDEQVASKLLEVLKSD